MIVVIIAYSHLMYVFDSGIWRNIHDKVNQLLKAGLCYSLGNVVYSTHLKTDIPDIIDIWLKLPFNKLIISDKLLYMYMSILDSHLLCYY